MKILKTEKQEYTLRLRCRDFRRLKDTLEAKDLMQAILDAMQGADVEAMAKCLTVIAEPMLTIDQAYDVLDEYLAAEEHTVMGFGGKLLEVLDDAGFLPKKGMAKSMTNAVAKTLDKIDIEKAVEEAASQKPKEFAGFRA